MIEVLDTGYFSTIQDLGRKQYRKYGVPLSGVLDLDASKKANLIVGNNENSALIEMTLTGAKIVFHVNTIIAITGAEMTPKINNISVSNFKLITVNKGDILSFGTLKSGYRTYLAVKGGVKVKNILGSKS